MLFTENFAHKRLQIIRLGRIVNYFTRIRAKKSSLSITGQHSLQTKIPDQTPLTVRVSPHFAKSLCTPPEEAPRPEPGSPAAKGGLLFGIVGDDLITIQAFRGFEIHDEQESNSSAHEHFDKCVGELSAAAPADPELAGSELIGWCYVRRDGSTGFLERDAQFHNRHFPRETDVLLVLKPEEQGVSIELFARSSSPPLSTERYRYGSLSVRPETPVNPPIEVKLEARNDIGDATRRVPANTRALAQVTPSPGKNKLFWLLSAAMFVFAVGITFGWAYIRAHYLALARNSQSVLGSIPKGRALRIRVESSGNAVLVNWDRNTTLARSAKHGILRIDDGPVHRDVNLEPSDIENSSIVYRPGSNDARFRLELRDDHGSAVSNTVRVLDGSMSVLNPDIDANAGPETLPSPAYVPPQALKRVSPNTKSFELGHVRDGTEVDVQVRIDEYGRVIEAHVKSGTNDSDSLRSAALEAAKQWIFEPAKSYGKNIPSDHTVAFQFHP